MITTIHRQLASGRVITWQTRLHSTAGVCIDCGQESDGNTVETFTLGPEPARYPMCFWCLELWDARGWLKPHDLFG